MKRTGEPSDLQGEGDAEVCGEDGSVVTLSPCREMGLQEQVLLAVPAGRGSLRLVREIRELFSVIMKRGMPF